MWPSRSKEDGVHLSYGHDGMGLYLPHITASRPWNFARRHQLGFKFHQAGDDTCLVSPSLTEQDYFEQHKGQCVDLSSNQISSLNHTTRSGTHDLILDFTHESAALESAIAHDPTVGCLMTIGQFNQKNSKEDDSENVIAYVTGKNGWDLNVTLLDFEQVSPTTKSENDKDLEPIGNFKKRPVPENDSTYTVNVPILGKTGKISLNSSIKQIQFAEVFQDQPAHHFLVRTSVSTQLILTESSNSKSTINLRRSYEIPYSIQVLDTIQPQIAAQSNSKIEYTDSYRTFTHVDVAFNPWNHNQFGVISSDGSWLIYNIENRGIKSTPIMGSLVDERDISDWHKIIWGSDKNNILVCNRRVLRSYDLKSGVWRNLLLREPGTSTIRDIKRSPIKTYEILVLTSDSLIWMDIRKSGKTILSWDHFMHAKDSTLTMSVTKIDNTAYISLNSKLVPGHVVYQFSEAEGLPISSDDPYYIPGNPQDIVQDTQIMTLEIPDVRNFDDSSNSIPFYIAQFSFINDYSLLMQLYCTDPSIELVSDQMRGLDSVFQSEYVPLTKNISLTSTPLFQTKGKTLKNINDYRIGDRVSRGIFLLDFRGWYQNLFIIAFRSAIAAQNILVEDYAKDIEESVKLLFKQPDRDSAIETLYDLARPASTFENINEVADMLEELVNHYEKTSVNVISLDEGLKTIFDGSVKGVAGIYQYFLDLWVNPLTKDDSGSLEKIRQVREIICRKIAISVSMSCIGLWKCKERRLRGGQAGGVAQRLPFVSKYTGLKDSHKVPDTVKILLKEWEVGSDVSAYSWKKFASNGFDNTDGTLGLDATQRDTQSSFFPYQISYSQKPLPVSSIVPAIKLSSTIPSQQIGPGISAVSRSASQPDLSRRGQPAMAHRTYTQVGSQIISTGKSMGSQPKKKKKVQGF
ncbi:hypothetical protein NADFUDRAFT_39459 [Nadsonia fulvescens var. elongata DSM 6958]|uniref:Uncharacterized protein n=1 Tax=Nadsonia fulvescens var. elongata DSM 6958 TaxID=857566 RepID=A0A1E3PRK5_9ASCO|nr:hypothetical protein NADFUDRAFT_39459 [Nadsonia fulvescens var. elongata DSM 6958]